MTPIASTGQVPPDVGMAIAKKVLDTVEQQGNAMVGLIADAASAGESARGAVSPAAAVSEPGANLDTYA